MDEEKFKTKNPREAAFHALQISRREEGFVDDFLVKWKEIISPDPRDCHLAREISYGTMRMTNALDYITEALSKRKSKLKLKEKVIIRTAIYQHLFMDKIPEYAIVNEAVKLAKKYCHESYVRYVNALLRKLMKQPPSLPSGNTVPELSIRYSYPPFFIQELVNNYGVKKATEIMEAGNSPGIVTARVRKNAPKEESFPDGIEVIPFIDSYMVHIRDTSVVPIIAESSSYYIQNITQANLIDKLCKDAPTPKRILDLCASPGGKLISTYDHFPDSEFYGNDVSENKVKRLRENCEKYGIQAHLSCSSGETYSDPDPYDLIILDVPCSNTGVLNKRPEARWRISRKSIEQLEATQNQLINHAMTLLAPGGELWYITCSILKKENTQLIKKAIERHPLEVRIEEQILPNTDGWDGGYACALKNIE